MASGLVRRAFSFVFKDGMFTGTNEQSKTTVLHEVNLLISKVAEDIFAVSFDHFARKLLPFLESLVGGCCSTVQS